MQRSDLTGPHWLRSWDVPTDRPIRRFGCLCEYLRQVPQITGSRSIMNLVADSTRSGKGVISINSQPVAAKAIDSPSRWPEICRRR